MKWNAIAGALMLTAAPAWAYGDPNSAGLLYQTLLPIIAMGMFFFRAIARRLREGVKWLKARLTGQGDDGQSTEEA